jgi:hypothetical protein
MMEAVVMAPVITSPTPISIASSPANCEIFFFHHRPPLEKLMQIDV